MDKKRFDDGIEYLTGDGGLIDKLAEKAGPLGGFIKLLKPVLNKFKQSKGQIILAKQGDKEGFLNTETLSLQKNNLLCGERKI